MLTPNDSYIRVQNVSRILRICPPNEIAKVCGPLEPLVSALAQSKSPEDACSKVDAIEAVLRERRIWSGDGGTEDTTQTARVRSVEGVGGLVPIVAEGEREPALRGGAWEDSGPGPGGRAAQEAPIMMEHVHAAARDILALLRGGPGRDGEP